MISLITGALYYSSNWFSDLLGFIFGIAVFLLVGAFCSGVGSSENSSSKTNRSNSNYYGRSNYSSYSFDPYEEQTNYDPTWDDAFFEKTGIEPWFDDNPWDHEKK
ncbi:MAG: hypothetical protein IJQ68_06120 [Methanobrevibacter sp.]|uniref:hypothetical protein n=1 Tax=Methanobrevibacter sp. TaxID=66852 RepID=UPI0025D34989|nr:hypothetical protein [Methanobrevibacter sp.]MBR0271549.1 hypothetical protein [Methanobrevibacter sp.]